MTMHEGHRRRLRERFRREGLENFAPHEVLELLLFYARARGDVNPLAHRLLDTFGSLRGVLEAPVDQLCTVEGVGEETATLISMMVPMFARYELCLCEEKRTLSRYKDMLDFCSALLKGLRKERFYVICLSAQMRVLGYRMVAEGSLSEVPAYPRLVVETALNQNAYAVVLCHNHPGGEAMPSRGDVEVTRNLEGILARLGIALLEHIIVADEQTYSMTHHDDYQCSVLQTDGVWSLREAGAWDDEWA
ncbi:MAG: DNA repair protein RadC [Clostridiales bacterium]|nr:DNA repair protein RadC [Clostridiales bacterium]